MKFTLRQGILSLDNVIGSQYSANVRIELDNDPVFEENGYIATMNVKYKDENGQMAENTLLKEGEFNIMPAAVYKTTQTVMITVANTRNNETLISQPFWYRVLGSTNGGNVLPDDPETWQAYIDEYLGDKLDKKTEKVQIDYTGGVFKVGDKVLNFADIYDYLKTSPDFVYVLYGMRAHLCTYINDGGTLKEIRFASPILSDGVLKMSSIYITSTDATTIAGVSVTNINCENTSNKVNAITDANKNSSTFYPTVKATNDAIEAAKQELNDDLNELTPINYGYMYKEFETVKNHRNSWLYTSRYGYMSKNKPSERDAFVDSVLLYLEVNELNQNYRDIVFTFASFNVSGNSITDIVEAENITVCVKAENIYTFKLKNKFLLEKGKYFGFKVSYGEGEAPYAIGSYYPDNACQYGLLAFNAEGVRTDNIPTWNLGFDFVTVNEKEWINIRPLYGKKWVAYGDSITAGYRLRGYQSDKENDGNPLSESYVKLISDYFGINFKNYGQSGRGYSLSTNWNGKTIVSALNDPSADIVTIAFGTNDFGEVATYPTLFGDVDGTDTDDTNFCGAVRATYEMIISKYTNPKTNVFVFLPISRATEKTPNTYGKILDDYAEAIKKIARRYHFPVLDMFGDSAFKATQANFANAYYQEGAVGALHPNDEGQMLYYVPIVERFLLDNYRE